ncbi:spindle assembly checkpoint component Mad1 [Naematelia encephala]|uniref:Spindle assembly checkpoint component MAD1 n=1 Tax=Naematelia encephala TaxID=71784 RepID=A0A1Y2AFL0_9TREE|nr:spindle assembly checkpoint component Mad1 [Naematelia encephala]
MSRLPIASRLQTTSLLAPLESSASRKRGASDAGIENEPPHSRKSLSSSTQTTTLQRRILTLEGVEAEQARRIEEQQLEIERLKGERMVLYEGEKEERETGEEREKQWAEERLRLSRQVSELRSSNSALKASFAQLETEHSHLSHQHAALSLNSSAETTHLKSRIKELEEERESLRGWERRARGLSIDLEEERRKAEERRRGAEDEAVDRHVDDTVRKELRRQSQHLATLDRNHASLQSEVIELRQKCREADAADRAAKEIERTLKEQIRTLELQLERARRDMDSLTQNFSSTSISSEDTVTLQNRLSALSALHQKATQDLVEKDSELQVLQERFNEYQMRSTASILSFSKRAEEAERELRWAKEGRMSAERREQMARAEIDALRALPAGDSGVSTADSAGRIAHLETLVETFRREVEGMQRDSREVEDRITQGAGLVKASLLSEAEERIGQLEREIQSLESTISQLTSANTTLDAEVNDLMRRVASGEYNPQLERCIELRANPAHKIHAVRTQVLDDLRRENEALLDRLAKVDRAGADGADGQGLVPRESFDRLRKEKDELERAHAKRLLRLKEIFGNKSKEFLEAVYSLLGWRIKFDESGADIRLTSMYAPKGKMGLTLKFASQEGHFGTMQMTGALAKGLEESRHFWIVERQSVPGFLAQVTTEMFEKTTIGRAAGYVGLE